MFILDLLWSNNQAKGITTGFLIHGVKYGISLVHVGEIKQYGKRASYFNLFWNDSLTNKLDVLRFNVIITKVKHKWSQSINFFSTQILNNQGICVYFQNVAYFPYLSVKQSPSLQALFWSRKIYWLNKKILGKVEENRELLLFAVSAASEQVASQRHASREAHTFSDGFLMFRLEPRNFHFYGFRENWWKDTERRL